MSKLTIFIQPNLSDFKFSTAGFITVAIRLSFIEVDQWHQESGKVTLHYQIIKQNNYGNSMEIRHYSFRSSV